MENQKRVKRLKQETTTVFVCPFCYNEIYFGKPHELAKHLYDTHTATAYRYLADQCKQTAIKGKNGKWGLKQVA